MTTPVALSPMIELAASEEPKKNACQPAGAAQTLCRCWSSALNGQPDGERGTPRNAADVDRAAVRSDHGVDDGQSKPSAAVGARAGGIATGEALEHVRQQVRRHT